MTTHEDLSTLAAELERILLQQEEEREEEPTWKWRTEPALVALAAGWEE